MKNLLSTIGKVLLWGVTIFFVFSAIVFFPSLGSLFAVLFAILIVPAKPLQSLTAQIFRTRTTKTITLIVLFFLTVSFSTTSADSTDQSIEIDALVEVSVPKELKFEIHFLDVGQADAILVLCDEQAMLVDGGDADDSSFIYSYLKDNGIEHLDIIVCTHAHSDHAGGLAGALNYSTVGRAYAPVTESENSAFKSFVEYLKKQNVSLTIPDAGDVFSLGSAVITVLGPINPTDNPNNTSIVLRIEYGDTSFLLTGDAEAEEENDIINSGHILESTVLKVGHHGSSTSSGSYFIAAVNPEYAVISDGIDASGYGRLTERTLEKLLASGAEIYRTDVHGNIICASDGKKVSFRVENSPEPTEIIPLLMDSQTINATETPVVRTKELPESSIDSTLSPKPTPTTESTHILKPTPVEREYILNTNSRKFHYPYCSSAEDIKASNKAEFFGTRDEIRKMGYEPCGRCKP